MIVIFVSIAGRINCARRQRLNVWNDEVDQRYIVCVSVQDCPTIGSSAPAGELPRIDREERNESKVKKLRYEQYYFLFSKSTLPSSTHLLNILAKKGGPCETYWPPGRNRGRSRSNCQLHGNRHIWPKHLVQRLCKYRSDIPSAADNGSPK